MLKVEGLYKSFGGQVLFRDLSWSIGPRDRIALVGPNGSGKSTLLRMIAGIERPDSGTIEHPKRLRIGYLAQYDFTLGGGTVRQEAERAFADVVNLRARLEAIDRRLEAGNLGEEEAQRLAEQRHSVEEQLAASGGFEIERRIHAVLTGLGFHEAEFDSPLDSLSGGWRMRAALARLLLESPDLMLLDEPTNHLDLEAREWLAGFLEAYKGAFVLVSHDRYFLDRTVRKVCEIASKRLEEYAGDFSHYERERERRFEMRLKAYEKQQEEIKRLERFIERFRAKARHASLVQSRIRRLERIERLEPPERPGRSIVVRYPAAPRSGRVVLELRRVSKSYGSKIVFEGVDLVIQRGKRIALVGPNGAGKSTLMRILAGVEPPDSGERIPGHAMLPAFFAQDRGFDLDPSSSVLETVMRIAPTDFVPYVRELLGAFLFSGDSVEKRVSVLSGGEKNRLALACLLTRPTNLLLLDEPTNHLDIPAKDALLAALRGYPGTVVFVSHDRRFLEQLCDWVFVVGGGAVREYPGGYADYIASRASGARESSRAREEPDSDRSVRQAVPRPPGARRRRRGRLQERVRLERLQQIEAQIEEKEKQRENLSELLRSPGFFANHEKARIYVAQIERLKQEIDDLYERWAELAEDAE